MAKGLIINSYAIDIIAVLDDNDAASLLRVLVAYYRGDAIPEMTTPVRIAFNRIADDNSKFDPEHRKEVSILRSEIGKKGAAAKWGTDGKQWQTMANDGKPPLLMANEANPHKEKDIDIDKEKNIEKKSMFEEEGGKGEGETSKTMSSEELNQFLSGATKNGLSKAEALRIVKSMGLLHKESPQT